VLSEAMVRQRRNELDETIVFCDRFSRRVFGEKKYSSPRYEALKAYRDALEWVLEMQKVEGI